MKKKTIILLLIIIAVIGGILTVKLIFENLAYKHIYGLSKQEIEKGKHTINIWAKPNTPEPSLLKLKELIESHKSVEFVKYTSSEQSLANFWEKNKDDTQLLEDLERSNPFGATFSITITNPSQRNLLIDFIRANDTDSVIEQIS